MPPIINGLTGLRGFAALWVMVFHVAAMAGIINTALMLPIGENGVDVSFILKGWMGINVFFVLTGFLLFLPFAGCLLDPAQTISLKHYYKRRALRILPAY
jgi:peptidoglycan/LPS O-acetylase OafA/YrhL